MLSSLGVAQLELDVLQTCCLCRRPMYGIHLDRWSDSSGVKDYVPDLSIEHVGRPEP